MRRICISAGCQTGGIDLTLQEIFPRDEMILVPIADHSSVQFREELLGALPRVDAWISIDPLDFVDWKTLNPRLQAFRVPPLWFAAFHPDLCYATKNDDNSLLNPHYNSAIGVWAYGHGIDSRDASRLFDTANFFELGYFGEWDRSVRALRASFERCGMGDSFEPFFQKVKRLGVFMHSSNHPKIEALVALGKEIAIRLGADPSVRDRDICVSDGLATAGYWPIYPEFADFYSLPSNGYVWRNLDGQFDGIPSYLDYMFSCFRRQGVEPGGCGILWREMALYDRVLLPASRRSSR